MHPELLYKSSPLESSKAYIMEFTDYLEQCVSDKSGEPLSLHRQRILAAQIQDGELGTEDVLLANADTFDSSVETNVLANESALMEMDEVITQIQQWRQLRPAATAEDGEHDEEVSEHRTYRSQAYDSLFGNKDGDCGPETDAAEGEHSSVKGTHKEKQYVADEEMVRKLHSLQSMIKERQSTASKELSARHVTEYTALVTLMKSRFGDNLLVPEEDEFDDIDTGVSAAAGTRSRNNNAEDMRHGCGNSGIYQTIELEVREGNYRASRQREEEVIQQNADLQQEVATLEDTLRNYSSDLDRLLQG